MVYCREWKGLFPVKQAKTNALRLLERAKIAFTPLEYEAGDGAIDGISVAQKTGQNPDTVFKTLVARASSGGLYVFCIPVAHELDLKKAAKAAGEKSVAMLHVAEITPLTGYVRGGCSPIGMKKAYPTFIHQTAQQYPFIVVSGGRIGLQIQIAPTALAAASGAKMADLCL